jgi:hypothetical protein
MERQRRNVRGNLLLDGINQPKLAMSRRLGLCEGRSLTSKQAREFLEAAGGERLGCCYQLMLACAAPWRALRLA